MHTTLRSAILAILISSVLSVFLLNWIINDDPFKFFMKPRTLAGEFNGIERIHAEFVEKQIYLHVHLKAPMTCPKAIRVLGIGKFTVKGKQYKPSCEKIDENLLRIAYTEIK